MRFPRQWMVALLGTPVLYGQVSEKARQLHKNALVFDGHIHAADRRLYHGGNIGERAENGQFDLPRAIAGGVDAMFFSVFVSEDYYPQRMEVKQTLRLVDVALSQIERNRDRIETARNASDVTRIQASGKIAAVLDLEGGFDLDGDLAVLRMLYRLGLRSAQLTAHNWTNNFADPCCSPAKHGGLTERGRAVIGEMNRLGMVINISHAADTTLEQAIETSSDPLIATHHGLRSFNNIPRTMPDHLVRKLAAKGGVIGFHIGNEFHNVKAFEWRTKNAGRPFWDTSEIARRNAPMTIEEIDRKVARQHPMMGVRMPDEVRFGPKDWLAVVERAIELAGEDHVALGSDFDGGPTPPKGISDVSDLPVLTQAMLDRGWSETRIRKFLGENLLRVFRRISEK